MNLVCPVDPAESWLMEPPPLKILAGSIEKPAANVDLAEKFCCPGATLQDVQGFLHTELRIRLRV